MLTYSQENYPSLNEQSEFFRFAFMEGDALGHESSVKRGPYYTDFVSVVETIDQKLHAINPGFTPEYIMPTGYRSPQVTQAITRQSIDTQARLRIISEERLSLLDRLAQIKLKPEMMSQAILPHTLDVPVYCQQGGEWKDIQSTRGCTNACFRMIFGSITGWTPSETAIAEQLQRKYGTAVVEDSIFYDVYQAEIFKEICDREVVNIEVIGADLNIIRTLATRLKQREQNTEVYCVVNLASKTATKDIWHTSILLEANDKEVLCHDPSKLSGGPYTRISYDEFVHRWAATYNRVQFIIAR